MSNFDRFPLRNAAELPKVLIRAVAAPSTSPGVNGDQLDGPDLRAWLAAIVEGSDDAIVSKDLNGVIRSWNAGAERLFGHTAEQAIGQPILMLIPEDRRAEEPEIIAQISQGNRVEHFETQRLRRDGTLVDISLTISPIYNRQGVIVGASKIARDITERLRHEEQQRLLIGEMHHRVKNLFALASAVVSLSFRSAPSLEEAPELIRQRMEALARAHDLTLANWRNPEPSGGRASLHALLQTIVAPYESAGRIAITGPDIAVGGAGVTNLALILHELATNAAKYGALSVMEGRLAIETSATDKDFLIVWEETGGPPAAAERAQGFGSRLERGLSAALGARLERSWRPQGLAVQLRVPRSACEA